MLVNVIVQRVLALVMLWLVRWMRSYATQNKLLGWVGTKCVYMIWTYVMLVMKLMLIWVLNPIKMAPMVVPKP